MTQAVNHEHRAFQAWNILVEVAGQSQTITYKELAERIGVHPRACRYFLDPMQQYCLEEKLPPITSIIVNPNAQSAEGVISWDTDNLEDGQEFVFRYNWKNYPNPFSYASDEEDHVENLSKALVKGLSPDRIYQKVNVRGIAQHVFRQALMEVYDNQCAFCHFKVPEALEAVHIIPWSHASSRERLDLQNGLLLCSNHQKLFEQAIYSIGEDFTIEMNDGYKSKLSGKSVRLPKKKKHKPSLAYIKKRNALLK